MLSLLPFGCSSARATVGETAGGYSSNAAAGIGAVDTTNISGRKLRRYRYSLLAVAPEALRHPALLTKGPQRGEGTSPRREHLSESTAPK